MQIELCNIHKYYGSTKANNGISLKVLSGTIHGILGENGAGKSTLMKILAGVVSRTAGHILINGAPVAYATPAQASRLGIGMLYQDPLDFPQLSALDNFMLGQSRGFSRRRNHFTDQFVQFCQRLNFSLAPEARVSRLTVGERQQRRSTAACQQLLNRNCWRCALFPPLVGVPDWRPAMLALTAVKSWDWPAWKAAARESF